MLCGLLADPAEPSRSSSLGIKSTGGRKVEESGRRRERGTKCNASVMAFPGRSAHARNVAASAWQCWCVRDTIYIPNLGYLITVGRTNEARLALFFCLFVCLTSCMLLYCMVCLCPKAHLDTAPSCFMLSPHDSISKMEILEAMSEVSAPRCL